MSGLELQRAVAAALKAAPALADWPVRDGAQGAAVLPAIEIGPERVDDIGAKGVRLRRHRFGVTLHGEGPDLAGLKAPMAAAEQAVLLIGETLGAARLVRISFLRSFTRRDVRSGAVVGELDFEAVIEG